MVWSVKLQHPKEKGQMAKLVAEEMDFEQGWNSTSTTSVGNKQKHDFIN